MCKRMNFLIIIKLYEPKVEAVDMSGDDLLKK